jgi:8-oxo-dGTP pyrophosphatase MutT (NUDIX family)
MNDVTREPRLPFGLRQILPLYWRLTRGLTLGVRAVIYDEQNRVLLVRHTYVSGWHLPGGGVEVGESLINTLTKELREETSITLKSAPHLHGVFFNQGMAMRDHVAVFIVRDFAIEPYQSNPEIAEIKFFEVGSLPQEVTAATRRRIEEILHGEPPSPFW